MFCPRLEIKELVQSDILSSVFEIAKAVYVRFILHCLIAFILLFVEKEEAPEVFFKERCS